VSWPCNVFGRYSSLPTREHDVASRGAGLARSTKASSALRTQGGLRLKLKAGKLVMYAALSKYEVPQTAVYQPELVVLPCRPCSLPIASEHSQINGLPSARQNTKGSNKRKPANSQAQMEEAAQELSLLWIHFWRGMHDSQLLGQ
jgi:hypothetical protein